jgi:hypothetical protein
MLLLLLLLVVVVVLVVVVLAVVLPELLAFAARAACTVGCRLSRKAGMGMASETCLRRSNNTNTTNTRSKTHAASQSLLSVKTKR